MNTNPHTTNDRTFSVCHKDVKLYKDFFIYLLKILRKEKVVLNTYLYKKLRQTKLSLKDSTLRKRTRSILEFLEKNNVIKINNISKKLYEVVLLDSKRLLDLMNCDGARNHHHKAPNKKQSHENTDLKQIITSCILPRYRASTLFYELNDLRLRSQLNDLQIQRVVENFELYINDIKEKLLLFKDNNDEYVVLPYSSRFITKSKAIEQLKKLENAFEIAKENNWNGIFLTLTIPPVFPFKIQQWILNYLLHRIKALIRKIEKKTYPHIKAIEPQQSFLIHYHIIIFGLDYLMPKHKLTEYLEKHLINLLSNLGNHYKRTINKRATEDQINALNILGKQLLKRYNRYKKRTPNYVGPINWITKIKIEENAYVFENNPPNRKTFDGGYTSVFDYIKYYVLKNAFEAKKIEDQNVYKCKNPSLAFYWFLRLPFFTLSPFLREKMMKEKAGWIFLGSIYKHELEEVIWKRNG